MTTAKKTTKIDAKITTANPEVAKTFEAKATETVKARVDPFKGYENVIAYNRNNVDALMKVTAIWAKCFQDLNKEMTVLANSSMEQSVTATKQILGCKTIEEVVALQSDLAQVNYDKAVAKSRKLSEIGVKLAETAVQPIAVLVNETVANFSKPLAS